MEERKLFIGQLPVADPGLAVYRDRMPDSGEEAIRVEVGPEGGRLYFTGRAGQVGGVEWKKEDYLVVPVYQNTEHSLFMRLLFWEQEPHGEAPHASIAMGVFPGFTVQVVFPLSRLDLATLFLPRTPGRLKNVSTGIPVEVQKVVCMALEIPASVAPQSVWFGWPRLCEREPEYKIPEQPVVDELGQWMQKDWKGKTRSAGEMVTRLQNAVKQTAKPIQGPFDAYGGWTERTSRASGFFRTEHDGSRWWLIDPDGHPFFSVGPDCVRPHMAGPVKGIESLFSWLPPKSGGFEAAWTEQRKSGEEMVCYSTANLIRAFGDRWMEQWEKLTVSYLRQWGFNTIANWSVEGIGQRHRLPYVFELKRFPTTQNHIFRDFPDVFSPEYAKNAEECVQELGLTATDPYMIGYFLRNEPNWGFGDYNIAGFLLAHPDRLHSKEALIRFLSERYQGDAARLGAAWNYPLSSFEELFRPVKHAQMLSDSAAQDLTAFTRILIDEYIRVPAQAARKVDPNHLNLGMRWAWVASDAFYAGSQYCDVFSINCYKLNPSAEEIRAASAASGLPVMIGEFHAGALDVGLPSNGLRGMANQKERGRFYSWYVEHAAVISELIGAHYFQWGDQPVLGRFDGENCNIGLVDICHKPYEEMLEHVVKTHERLYRVCAGLEKPTDEMPLEVPREGF